MCHRVNSANSIIPEELVSRVLLMHRWTRSNHCIMLQIHIDTGHLLICGVVLSSGFSDCISVVTRGKCQSFVSSDCFSLPKSLGQVHYVHIQMPEMNHACTLSRWRNDAVFPCQSILSCLEKMGSITPADESAHCSQVWLLFLRGQSIAKPCAEYQGLD